MKKSTHIFYITVIAVLLLMNIAIYMGKNGIYNTAADNYDAAPMTESAEDARINLNEATADELMTINGIGPATADKIIKRREAVGGFRAVEDLLSVDGIGSKKFEDFKEYVYVDVGKTQD